MSKILILEDDPATARAYEEVLRKDGNDVTVCGTFEKAREILLHDYPDAVVTDIRLGEYNGLQLALLFRSGSPEGRVVVVTGFQDDVIRKDVLALGGTFLVKPIQLSQLREALYGSEPKAVVSRKGHSA